MRERRTPRDVFVPVQEVQRGTWDFSSSALVIHSAGPPGGLLVWAALGWMLDSAVVGGVWAGCSSLSNDLSLVSHRQGPGGRGHRQQHGPPALRLHGWVPLEPGLRVLPPQHRVRAGPGRPAPVYGLDVCVCRLLLSHAKLALRQS